MRHNVMHQRFDQPFPVPSKELTIVVDEADRPALNTLTFIIRYKSLPDFEVKVRHIGTDVPHFEAESQLEREETPAIGRPVQRRDDYSFVFDAHTDTLLDGATGGWPILVGLV